MGCIYASTHSKRMSVGNLGSRSGVDSVAEAVKKGARDSEGVLRKSAAKML